MNGAQPRDSSPSPGSSILTISAPMSPSIMVQKGPARTRVRSTTLRPVSGGMRLSRQFKVTSSKFKVGTANFELGTVNFELTGFLPGIRHTQPRDARRDDRRDTSIRRARAHAARRLVVGV